MTAGLVAAAALAVACPARVTLRPLLAGSIGLLAALGLLAGGPVGGVVAGSYAALGARALRRRTKRRKATAERTRTLDDLAGLAADLRAGLPPTALASTSLTSSVWRLAERTGAPAADLVERIEADARSADRAAATAAAQAAGAQATAMLLAALPLGGIGLGITMGADPLGVLLHTPIGAACAIAAVLLQSGGLLWSERLVAA